MAFTYLIFGIILLSYLLIFQIRDILFPNGMKPIKPVNNFNTIIYYLSFISIGVRIFSIIAIFLYLFYSASYQKALKENIMNSISTGVEEGEKKLADPLNLHPLRTQAEDQIRSLNNAESQYTSSTAEEKNACEETTIRISMDELNEKIKAGEIFSDNRSSRASMITNNNNNYNLII